MSWRTKGGAAVASHSRGPVMLKAVTHPQMQKLDAMIQAAQSARGEAAAGNLFASEAGKILTNAAHDLFEVDGLYEVARGIGFELGQVESL